MNENNKIAKNSLFLNIKLIITTLIGLFSTKVILNEIGANDFGLYSLLAGLVFFIAVLNSAMLATTYRFISVEVGKDNNGEINKIFNRSLIIHFCISLLFVLLSETIGIWYINNYLNVNSKSLNVIYYIFQTSVIATFFSIVSVPYQGLIIAKEKFLIKVTIELISDLIKLGLVFYLVFYTGDKLIMFANLMMIVVLIQALLSVLYCLFREKDNIKWKFDKLSHNYKEMLSFTGWIFLGTISHLGVRQGSAILINLFFGTTLNAAYGLSTQVYNYIQLFVSNVSQAAIPQIMKSQSIGDGNRSLILAYSISKYSFLVMLIISVPILLSVKDIFFIWLHNVPNNTVEFTVLLILNGLIGVLGSSFNAIIQATGKIKSTQIWYSISMLFVIPLTFISYKLGMPVISIGYITIFSSLVFLFIQMSILEKSTSFNSSLFYLRTIKPVIIVVFFALPQYYIRHKFGHGIMDIIFFSILSVSLMLLIIYFFGLTKNERNFLNNLLSRILSYLFQK
jgi:O-antigen/teichoic acid export membrane protein